MFPGNTAHSCGDAEFCGSRLWTQKIVQGLTVVSMGKSTAMGLVGL